MRLLSKSRWKLASSCPTKLFYTGKPEYPNNNDANEFMEALAEGGFQVGAMAKEWYPHGHEVYDRNPEVALRKTNELLKGDDDVVIFEAALAHDNLLIRADIFMRFGGKYFIKEVKAKSWDPQEDSYIGKRGGILAEWKPFLEDLAFQRYVASKAVGQDVAAAFLFVNKKAISPCDGIFQSFRVYRKDDYHKGVKVDYDRLPEEFLHERLLVDADATEALDKLVTTPIDTDVGQMSWETNMLALADAYAADVMVPPVLTADCGKCEFKPAGFDNCWHVINGVERDRPLVLEMKQYRNKDKMVKQKYYYMDMLDSSDFGDSALGLRQRRQLADVPVMDYEAFDNEATNWKWPLNFIDFETCAPALPLYKGFRPYQQHAFQFSHHVLHEDGRLEHFEFLHEGYDMPNYHFLRALKESLSTNEGTVFRWHMHENTILKTLAAQLQNDEDAPDDAMELIAFALSLCVDGSREMVDQYRVAADYYYHPNMKGSWSIKKVLPTVVPGPDPYKSLPSIHIDEHELLDDKFSELTELHDGGAAMTAWLACQNRGMGHEERRDIMDALLRYCHLDTKAMVWIYQAFARKPLAE